MSECEYMSPEAYAMMMDPTDPEECGCGHHGLPVVFHLSGCPLSVYTRGIKDD